MFPTFQESIERLARITAPSVPLPSKRAAVAIGLRDGSAGPEILMIQRAVREGDPWSGHMGFPGGRKDDTDASDEACAKRETLEEIGFDLEAHARCICQLSDVNTGWRADRPEMLVAPFVLTVLVIVFGFYPAPLIETFDISVNNLINNYETAISSEGIK